MTTRIIWVAARDLEVRSLSVPDWGSSCDVDQNTYRPFHARCLTVIHGAIAKQGHETSPQSGLGVGCKLCSSSKKLRGLSACSRWENSAPFTVTVNHH